MKSKEIKRYNLNEKTTFNEVIDAKPYIFLFVLMVIGFIYAFIGEYIIGTSFVSFYLACMILLPSRRLIEFYDEYMIVYNRSNRLECTVVYYEDVKRWEYKSGINLDELIITLEDDSLISINAYSRKKFEGCLNKYLKDKKFVVQKNNIIDRFKIKGNKDGL